MSKYAGLDWLEKSLPYVKPLDVISPLGKRVAELLGDLYFGIYHINKEVMKTNWTNDHWIQITLPDRGWSTFDFDNLTRFVFLCHEHGIRGTIEAASFKYVRLIFHDPNKCSGRAHPTIMDSLKNYDRVNREVKLEALKEKLLSAWCAGTAGDDWDPNCPSLNQGTVTALVVQDHFGGDMLRCSMPDGGGHYWNRLPDGTELDLTEAQFDYLKSYPIKSDSVVRPRSYVLSFSSTRARYNLLKERLERNNP